MNYRIALLYWGDGKYEPLLREWLEWYERAGAPVPVVIATDNHTVLPKFTCRYPKIVAPVDHWNVDPIHVFDKKGAITCELLQEFGESLLVLDADAFVRKDPTALLEPFANVPFAMPDDFGAQSSCLRLRPGGYQSKIPKRCAGVMWFGPGDRAALVQAYKEAFATLLKGHYQESRHLYEQWAWSMVADSTKAPFLPRTLNWADHIPRFGPNEEAAIYHRIGRRKWRKPTVSAGAHQE